MLVQVKEEKDKEFRASDEDEEDVEDTIAEQEKKEKKKDVAKELQELEEENEMSVEELMKKYAGAYDSDFEEELKRLEDEEDEGTESEGQLLNTIPLQYHYHSVSIWHMLVRYWQSTFTDMTSLLILCLKTMLLTVM